MGFAPKGGATARKEWYDRNSLELSREYYGIGVAPHGYTTRWTYTVPTGKKLFVECALASVVRITAATTAGEATAYVYCRGIAVVKPLLHTNGVGDKDTMNIGRNAVMVGGGALNGGTGDASTGGTTNLRTTALGIEFDA